MKRNIWNFNRLGKSQVASLIWAWLHQFKCLRCQTLWKENVQATERTVLVSREPFVELQMTFKKTLSVFSVKKHTVVKPQRSCTCEISTRQALSKTLNVTRVSAYVTVSFLLISRPKSGFKSKFRPSDCKICILVSTVKYREARALVFVASCLTILVANKPISALCSRLTLDVQKRSQVFEKTHLVAVVLGVVLYVPLMRPEVFNDVFLLSKLQSINLNTTLTLALKNSW